MPEKDLLAAVDATRQRLGFLTLAEVVRLTETDNVVLDPFSTLISRHAVIGAGNLFYPGVTVACTDDAELKIGSGNLFHSGSLIVAEAGSVFIGDENQFGDGGFSAKANRPGARIFIGNSGRYMSGAAIFGETTLGSGSQILGSIKVEDCTLEEGGSHASSGPDERAAVLKGQGQARNIHLRVGEVIFGQGDFSTARVERQLAYHPEAKARI